MRKKVVTALLAFVIFVAGYFTGYSRGRSTMRKQADAEIMRSSVYFYSAACGYGPACKVNPHMILAGIHGDPGELYVDASTQ